MLYLITGTPGAGKTQYTVGLVVDKLAATGRPIFHNIKGFNPRRYGRGFGIWLKFKFQRAAFLSQLRAHRSRFQNVQFAGDDPCYRWMHYPPNAIFVLDEVQDQWGAEVRKPEEYLKQLSVHRHFGFDFYLITQHPMLIAPLVRRLVSRHQHLYRPNGWSYSKLFTWSACKDDVSVGTADTDANVTRFKFDPRLWRLYSSAVGHHRNIMIPRQLVLGAIGFAALFGGLTWFAWDLLTGPSVYRAAIEPEASPEVSSPYSGCYPLKTLQPPVARLAGSLVVLPASTELVRDRGVIVGCVPFATLETADATASQQ